MSRHLLAILLSELKTVRVTCPKCAAVTELSVEKLGHQLTDPRCPVCQAGWPEFVGAENLNRLNQLGRVIADFQASPGAKHVEFVLPAPAGEKA